MGYCTVADIQAEFKKITFDTTTLVTSTAVQAFINEASALINSYVGGRYVTPVVGDADTLLLLSLYCRVLTSDRVRGILENKQQTNVDANQSVKHLGLTTADVLKALVDIKNNVTVLSGAELKVANAGFYSNNYQNSVSPAFKKRVRQW